jgi:hypothetical protein
VSLKRKEGETKNESEGSSPRSEGASILLMNEGMWDGGGYECGLSEMERIIECMFCPKEKRRQVTSLGDVRTIG